MVIIGSLVSCGGGNGDSGESGGEVAATLMWDPVVDPNVQGYTIYYGTQSRYAVEPPAYPGAVNVGANTAYTFTNLQKGTTYYFAVTAYNFSGLESAYSEEVSASKP